MSELPDLVSVIIPVRDAVSTLDGQLTALADQDYPGRWEVVVADNGSTDRSRELARGWEAMLPNLRVVDASARRGSAFARNRGVAAAGGEFLAFCEADDEVDRGWLSALVDAAPAGGMVGGFIDIAALNDDVTRAWRPVHPPEDCLPTHLRFLPTAIGANCGIWRSVLDDVGGWNEGYRAQTDAELSWRVQLASYRLGFAPDAVVRYRFRASLRALARQGFRSGVAEAQLYHDFRARGLRRDRPARILRTWVWLVLVLPKLVRSRERRGKWMERLAQRSGRLVGSVRHCVVFP